MRSRKKILIIVTRAELGGAQNHIASLVNNLDKELDFVLCTGTEGQLIETFDSLNLKSYVLPSLDKKRFFSSAVSIAKILIQEQPDLVHTHSAVASFVGRITAKLLRKKTLYTVHGWHFVPNSVTKRRLLGPILELIAKPFTDYWITVSRYDKKIGLKKNVIVKNRCSVVENGVADHIPITHKPQINKLNVAFIGRATYQKNCLAAIHIIQQCHPQIHLSIFSANGDHLPELHSVINDQSLNDRIKLIDNEEQAGEKLKDFDALLMTSRYEGMPLCALEAMRTGLPIVASDVCGMNEVVHHHENGYLYDLNDLDQASQYLNELLNEPNKRLKLGANSRAKFEENHLEKQMVEKTFQIYKKLLFR